MLKLIGKLNRVFSLKALLLVLSIGTTMQALAGPTGCTRRDTVGYLSCSTDWIDVPAGQRVYFGGATMINGDPAGGPANFYVRRHTADGSTSIVLSKVISSPYAAGITVTNPNLNFSARIVSKFTGDGVNDCVKAVISDTRIQAPSCE